MNQDKLTSPSVVTKILQEHGIRLTKAYGQHFLVDDNILQKIIRAADLRKDDVVLEVGPGIGTLSTGIAPKIRKLWLIELEKRFIPVLEQTLSEHNNVKLIRADAMKLNYSDLKPAPGKVVSNLPYNIAAPLIIKLLKECSSITEMIVMVQEEFARRLTAKPETADYGALTLKVSYLAQVKTLFKVSEQVFLPKPKVKSAVIAVRRHPGKMPDEHLFKIIEVTFRHRRKTIKSSLILAGFGEVQAEKALKKARIDKLRRPQSLSMQNFQELAKSLFNH